jgi:hypothetical protein
VGDSAWQIIAGNVLESSQGFLDTALLEAVVAVDVGCEDGASQFDHEKNNRGFVTFGTIKGRETCLEIDSDHAWPIFYRNQACRLGRDDSEMRKPSTWQPKCLVLLIEAESKLALRDELIKAGRVLTDPVNIRVNYTTATSPDPDLKIASTNCAIGHLLERVHAQDTAQRAELDALLKAEVDLKAAKKQRDLIENIVEGMSAYRPPPPPSNPPASAPASPTALTAGEALELLRDRVIQLETEVDERRAANVLCVPTAERTCGRSTTDAPNPWIAENGQRCIGYSTKEAFEGAWCSRWSSDKNVDAADSAEAIELLSEDGAPYCFSESAEILKCNTASDRAIRSGIYELDELARIDRSYCESQVFKEHFLSNLTATEGECRELLTQRGQNCRKEICRQCVSKCNYAAPRAVSGVLRCIDVTRHLGYVHVSHTTDAGQLARSLHGARRKDSYKPVRSPRTNARIRLAPTALVSFHTQVPERVTRHMYHIGHDNPSGLVQRDCKLCYSNSSPLPVACVNTPCEYSNGVGTPALFARSNQLSPRTPRLAIALLDARVRLRRLSSCAPRIHGAVQAQLRLPAVWTPPAHWVRFSTPSTLPALKHRHHPFRLAIRSHYSCQKRCVAHCFEPLLRKSSTRGRLCVLYGCACCS